MTSLTSAVVSDIMNVVTKKIKGTFFFGMFPLCFYTGRAVIILITYF